MNFLSQNVSNIASDIVIVLFLVLLTVGSVIELTVCLCKYTDSEAVKKKGVIAVILVVGFAVRFVFAMCIRGYRPDYKVFVDMFDHLRTDGIDGYYSGDPSTVLYPVAYFVYLIFGFVSNATGLSDFALGAQFMIKLPLIIADLFTALAVYKIASRYFNVKIGYALCAFVCICPVFFVGSVIWTSQLAFTVCFISFALYYMARKKYALTVAFATLAAFSSKEGIYIFPIIAVFGVYHIVRAVLNIRRDAPQGKKLLLSEYNAVYTVPVSFVLSIAVMYLIGLFMISSYNYNPFVYIYEFIIMPLSHWQYFTYNGLSVYSLFNQNGQSPSARFPSWIFVMIFALILFAVTCVVYFTKRNRATMAMLAAYALYTMQTYYPGSTAVGMSLALTALVAAYALVRDKRLLYVLFLIGIVYVVNSMSALANAGYLNDLADYNYNGLYDGYTLMSGGVSAVVIACSAISVLAHLYLTGITVSIGMTGQKRMLNHNDGIGGSIKELFARKEK